jgi:hypothetical protein
MYLHSRRTGKLDVSVTGMVKNVDGTDIAIVIGGKRFGVSKLVVLK